MSEFKVHHLVTELIEHLGSNASPESYVENLQRAGTTTVSSYNHATQNCVRQLAQNSPNRESFIEKYEELKAKNTDCLRPFIQLLSVISEDRKLKEYLEKNAKTASTNLQNSQTSQASVGSISDPLRDSEIVEKVTTEDLPVIRSRLHKEVEIAEEKRSLPLNKVETQEKARHPNYQSPVMPNWNSVRPNMNLDFVTHHSGPVPFAAPLGAIPVCSQESMVIEEILFCLEGAESDYIVPNPLRGLYETRVFSISESIDPSLHEMVKQILPLASHYSMVMRFIQEKSQFECGQVNHALTAAMNTLIKDYMVLVAQLETANRKGNFSIHKLWFFIQPTLHTMEILANIASTISKSGAKGGKVLSLLHERTSNYIGDPAGQELCLYLTQNACVPYMEILEKWVYKGVISDPYEEFLVEDNEVIEKEELPFDYSSDYWEKRYVIRREKIPVFLERVADVILLTGKYLNVIRQCGKNVKSPQAEEIVYTIKERQYVEAIEKAYRFASKTLLELLMQENDLMGRLRSVKHYFLLDQGDFIVQFMDSCEAELSKNIDDIVPTRLESLLELALRTSAANGDPYKDDMRTELLPYDLLFQMFKILSIETHEEKEYRLPSDKLHLLGLESFCFGYEVKWPVSLVLNRRAIACYQMIFRHLFYCKHVERLLCRVWICNKVAKSFALRAAKTYASAFALRQRMLNCVQNLEYYMMVEVIEPNWVTFLASINKVNNVDDVLVCHSDFLDNCLKDCMLTNPSLLRTVNKLMAICVHFCHFIQETPPPSPELMGNVAGESDSFEQSISKFNLQFTAVLVGLLDKISELGRENNNEKVLNILYRLDFNTFYTEQLERLCDDRSMVGGGKEETSG
ncbi:gamma-tubulin complex component 2-like isoform X2 [Zootermopsis nevadensis]|uniref:gamma-tubulin complex component 2-like isoform X2 n=1 Tax=Zootermopsis nevadensis TaxID=136037 RepID=UPI000B8E4C4D|nr:gamma-tubulin complex component 2-like isoform X2 [Zootermopsis nevadensis]